MITRAFVLVVAAACGGPATSMTSPTGAGSSQHASGSGSASAEEEMAGVGVALDVTPSDANVTIDGVLMGKVSELDRTVALAPGLHTIVIAQRGFKSYRVEFSVTDKVEKFVVKLEAAK
jgi:hypothetical protein